MLGPVLWPRFCYVDADQCLQWTSFDSDCTVRGGGESEPLVEYIVPVSCSRHILFIRCHRIVHKGTEQFNSTAENAQREFGLCANVCGCGRRTATRTIDPTILQTVPSARTEHSLRVNVVRMPRQSGHLRTGRQFSRERTSLRRFAGITKQSGRIGRTWRTK